ncbi:PAS domain S-box protein [Deltaproteobacteria bacterium TL4]
MMFSMNKVGFRSLESQLGLIFLLLLLLPTSFIGWMAYGVAIDVVKSDRIKAVGRVADARHEQMKMVFQRASERVEGKLADLRRTCVEPRHNPACVRQALTAFIQSEGALGATIHGLDAPLTEGESAVAEEIPRFKKDQLAQFTKYETGIERRYFIVAEEPGEKLRLAVTYSVKVLQSVFISHLDLGNSGETFLTDDQGFFITKARYPSIQGYSHPIYATPMLRCLTPENAETLDLDYRDVPIIHGFRFIPEIGGGCLMAHIDQAEAFGPLSTWRKHFFTFILVFAVLAVIVAIFFARWLTRPISQLTKVTHDIAAGAHFVRAVPVGFSEVVELAKAFNAMTDQLTEINAGLEQRVLERTESLREGHETLQDILATTLNGYWRVDLQGHLLEVNATYCQQSGYTRDELLGRKISELDVIKNPEETAKHIKQLKAKGSDLFESIHRRKDGSLWHVEVSATYRDSSGGQLIVFLHDISERIRTNEKTTTALKELEIAMCAQKEQEIELRQYKAIIDSSSDAIISKTLKGTIMSWNLGAEKLFGFTTQEAIGQSMKITIPTERISEEPEVLKRIANGERIDHFETVRCRKDGHLIDISATISPVLDERGNVIAISNISRDMTERKQVQSQLERINEQLKLRTIEAEEANRIKSEFISNMSHEIRTPMNAIIGLADLALSQNLSAKLRDYLSKIHTSSLALLSIINDILDFSKVEAGRLELDAQEFNLEKMLKNVFDLFITHAEEKGIELFVTIWPNVSLMLVGDGMRLGQVMNNLIGNAVKFTDSGEIHIKVEQTLTERGYTTLHFSVRDTGIGISREQLTLLFKPFTQADRSITRRFGGTGLGLTISQRLVEMMGGTISVESVPGQGSTFSFTLRFAVSEPNCPTQHEYAASAAPDINKIAASIQGARILLVEDNPVNVQVSQEILERAGFLVDVANNGQQALDLLPSERFDAVLMDVQMPVMDGFMASREIRKNPKFADLPIIAMTAAATDLDRKACLAAGMTDHVAKPIMPLDLMTVLKKWIKNGQTFDRNGTMKSVSSGAAGDPRLPAELPGFTLRESLALVSGNHAILIRVMRQFAGIFAKAADEMKQLLKSGQLDQAGALAHKLRGGAGNIGARELHTAAAKLEQEIKKAVSITSLELFERELVQVLSSIASLPEVPRPPIIASICEKCKWVDAKGLFRQLQVLLENHDLIPDELITELKNCIGCQEMLNDLDVLVRHVVNFDYFRALTLLQAIQCTKEHKRV